MKIAIIGAGGSGLSLARLLEGKHEVDIFESDSRPGGLSMCEQVNGSLYLQVGGHVFNSKRRDVLEWFWSIFSHERDFHKVTRDAVVSPKGGEQVDSPIENHLYQMPTDMRNRVIGDQLNIQKSYGVPNNFDEFYEAVVREDALRGILLPLQPQDMGWIFPCRSSVGLAGGKASHAVCSGNNGGEHRGANETAMVHSSFWYLLNGGTQFLADALAHDLNVHDNTHIESVERINARWAANGKLFDRIFYTGNACALPALIAGDLNLQAHASSVAQLEYHGTTSVHCEVDENPYNWVYMPSLEHKSHRITCTGNFSPNNDASTRSTATIEFSREMTREEIEEQSSHIPFNPKYLAHHWEPCNYPVQTGTSKDTINALKEDLHPHGFYLLGRLVEWEYYNMDAAMGASLDLIASLRAENTL